MKKITYLLLSAFLAVACTVDSIENEAGFEGLDAKNQVTAQSEVAYAGYSIDGFETTEWDLVQLHGKDSSKDLYKGKIFVTNDCTNLYVKIEGSDDSNLGIYETEADFPERNGKHENVSPDFEGAGIQPTTVTETYFLWSLSLENFDSNKISIFANAGGHSWAGEKSWGNARYFEYLFQLENCEQQCTYGKGWWRNHSNDNPGNQDNLWPVTELELGTVSYSQDELNVLLDKENKEGKGLVILAQHLTAAKLNVANGAGTEEIENIIQNADELIGGRNALTGDLLSSEKAYGIELKDALEAYNESSPCDDDEE